MTHREAIEIFYSKMAVFHPDMPRLSKKLHEWVGVVDKSFIPLIHIPEIAKIIGVKPSEIDPYFIGKDDLTIQWERKDER